MSDNKENRSSVIPGLRYRNAPAAIEWLCDVFGFAKHAVYAEPDGSIAHAQLTLGLGGMIMLGSARADEFGRVINQPSEIGGVVTQAAYLVVEDPDAIYRKVTAAGGEIVMEIKDESYGGRGFTCRDLEGNVWSIGSYDPWKTH